MNRLLITTCIFLWIGIAYVLGQDKSYHFGLSITPQKNIPRFQKSELSDSKTTHGVKAQVDFYYDISPSWQLTSGINISTLKISNIDYTPIFQCDLNVDGIQNVFNSWFEDEIDVVYLGIPVSAKRKLWGGENHLYGRLGAELLIKINSDAHSILAECGIPGEIDRNVVNQLKGGVLAAQLAIGYEMSFIGNTKLLLEPQLNYSLSSHYREASPIGDLTNNIGVTGIGLRVGVRY